MSSTVSSRAPLFVLVVALLLRVAAIVASPEAFQTDPDNYRALAENLLQHGVFGSGATPTAYRPPLYPLLLVPCVMTGHVAVAAGTLHVACGLVTVAATVWLARAWTGSRWSWLAGLLVAADPVLLRQTPLLMTETVATVLAAVSLVLLTLAARRGTLSLAALTGVSLGLAALCRPTFLPWGICCPIVLWFCLNEKTPKEKTLRAGAMLVAMLLTVAPWVVRNQIALGHPIVTTTHGGYTLLLANNERYYAFLSENGVSKVWTSAELDAEVVAGRVERARGRNARDELADDRAESAAGWKAIGSKPGGFAAAATLRLASLAGVLSQQLWAEGGALRMLAVMTGAWYLLQALLAARGAWRLWSGVPSRREWLAAVLLIGVFAGVHCFYWANNRMRAPLAPVIAVLAVAGLTHFPKPPQGKQSQSVAAL